MAEKKRTYSEISDTNNMSVHELSQRFKSKVDFAAYFSTCMNLYCPPKSQLDKEWIRGILSGEKKLIKMSDLQSIQMGNFPEVSVKNLWPLYKDREEVKDYFPTKIAKGRQIDKEYFFNIINSVLGDELGQIIEHAHKQRNVVSEDVQEGESIVLSQEMADALFQFPFISKSRGTTVHLLKQKAIKVRKNPERKKFELLVPKKKMKIEDSIMNVSLSPAEQVKKSGEALLNAVQQVSGSQRIEDNNQQISNNNEKSHSGK